MRQGGGLTVKPVLAQVKGERTFEFAYELRIDWIEAYTPAPRMKKPIRKIT